MSQKLILPVQRCKLTASMKTEAYRQKYGFTHYGVDMVDTAGNRTLSASGQGVVVGVGWDNTVGNVLAVRYTDARNHKTGMARDVIFRYFHLERAAVKEGQVVARGTALGVYGNTGSMPMANHLHLEADTDTAHPLYSPTVVRSNYLKGSAVGANDKTMDNPLDWLHCKTDAPENQTYATAGDAFIKAEDKTVETLAGATAEKPSAAELREWIAVLEAVLQQLKALVD